ncbi:MAG: hypothetical protein WCV80_02995 [Candidatus Paceibacterota bacterium]|jgi:hypothetical protein
MKDELLPQLNELEVLKIATMSYGIVTDSEVLFLFFSLESSSERDLNEAISILKRHRISLFEQLEGPFPEIETNGKIRCRKLG